MNDLKVTRLLHEVENEILIADRKIKDLVDRNSNLIRVLATIRQTLERTLKNPANLNEAVYNSINLCRANLVYTDGSTGNNKIDSPLTEEEKTLR